ncbi:MAG: hypothetical protein U9O65_09955, partial [Thermotogota bacterium]|nr:hypothetical protein [Thermotogota bacterium]
SNFISSGYFFLVIISLTPFIFSCLFYITPFLFLVLILQGAFMTLITDMSLKGRADLLIEDQDMRAALGYALRG